MTESNIDKRALYKELKKALLPIKKINVPWFYEYEDGFPFLISLPAKEKGSWQYSGSLTYRDDWTTKDYLEELSRELRSYHYDYKSDMDSENKNYLLTIGQRVYARASELNQKREFDFWKWVRVQVLGQKESHY